MYLFFSLIALAVGWYFDPGQISEIPFAELTIKKASSSLFSWSLYGLMLYMLIESIFKDRIWPWRWTLPYFGNLLLRLIFITLIVASPFFIAGETKVSDLGFTIALLAILAGILFAVFSPALNVFKEKASIDSNNQTELIDS